MRRYAGASCPRSRRREAPLNAPDDEDRTRHVPHDSFSYAAREGMFQTGPSVRAMMMKPTAGAQHRRTPRTRVSGDCLENHTFVAMKYLIAKSLDLRIGHSQKLRL